MFFKRSALFLVLCAMCLASSAATSSPSDTEIISMIDKLDDEISMNLFGGLTYEKTSETKTVTTRGIESLTERIVRYLKDHQLTMDLKSENVEGKLLNRWLPKFARSSKFKKLLLPILLALKFKAAVIFPVIFTVLTLVSVKALKAGLLALLFSGATFAKDFFEKKQERITTAYITSSNPGPVSAEIVTDWNRNGQITPQAQDIAYNAYNNYQTLPLTL
ncbi:unnamed protein product [Diamesa serratosioi]